VLQEAAQQWPNGCYFVILASQYFLWYGILGTVFGSKLLWLTKLLRPLGIVSQIFFGIPGGDIVLPGDKIPFAHSDEFIMVSMAASTDGDSSGQRNMFHAHAGLPQHPESPLPSCPLFGPL